jgi:hypothetical protein
VKCRVVDLQSILRRYYALYINQLNFEVPIDYAERRKTERLKMSQIKDLPQGELPQREKRLRKTFFYEGAIGQPRKMTSLGRTFV